MTGGTKAGYWTRNGDPGVPVHDYVDENVSDKVMRIKQSYIGVVNKMRWGKG